MTTAPQFDLTAAKQAASTKSDEDMTLAVGSAGNAMDDLLEKLWNDDGLTAAQKTSAFQAIAVNAAAIVQNAMAGNSGPVALGSPTQSSPAGVSQQDYDDLEDKKDAAETANNGLKEDRKILEQVMQFFGLTVPTSTNDRVAKDTLKLIKDEVQDRVDAAAAAPADMVTKSDAKAALNKIAAAEQDLETTRMSSGIDGRQKLQESITEALQHVS